MTRIGILDDGQGIAQRSADWSPLVARAELVCFDQPLGDGAAVVRALAVHDQEPLPADHPLRSVPHCVLSPHLGYCTHEMYTQFYRESVENVVAYLDGRPVRVLAP